MFRSGPGDMVNRKAVNHQDNRICPIVQWPVVGDKGKRLNQRTIEGIASTNHYRDKCEPGRMKQM